MRSKWNHVSLLYESSFELLSGGELFASFVECFEGTQGEYIVVHEHKDLPRYQLRSKWNLISVLLILHVYNYS